MGGQGDKPENVYFWNHRVQEQWGECRLCIWRLKFNPTFNEGEIREALEKVFRQAGIASFAVYELLGHFDLLLRIWLPNSLSLPRMEELLGEALLDLDYDDSEYFEVSRIVRHWVWKDPADPGRLLEPPAAVLASRPDAEVVAAMNRVFSGSARADDLTGRERELLEQWLGQDIIAVRPMDGGFKYFVFIRRPSAAGSRQAKRNLISAIADVCDRICDTFGTEMSLYEGSVEYLITGRFAAEIFHEGMAALLNGLSESGLSKLFLSRTHTAIALQQRFMLFQDSLATREGPGPLWPELSDLLLDGESNSVEFKSSLFANVRRWLASVQAGADPGDLVVDKKTVTFQVAKSVAGMLNSRLFGSVVIGVGERSRLEAANSDGASAVDSALSQYRVEGDFVLFGLALDYEALGSDSWDSYIRSAQQALSSTIVPDPAPFVKYARERIGDADFLTIRVKPTTSEWFYIEEDSSSRFYVRFDSLTRELRGRDQDTFKKDLS